MENSLARRALLAIVIALPQPVLPATITVTGSDSTVADDGECSLREAIISANSDTSSGNMVGECAAGSGADKIVLTVDVTLTEIDNDNEVVGPTGLPSTFTTIEIQGNNHIVGRDADAPDFRIFRGLSRGFAENDLTLLNTIVTGGRVPDHRGGGILGGSEVTLINSTVLGNSALSGGGIYTEVNYGDLTLVGSVVSGNASTEGGGIDSRSGTVNLVDSTVSGNSASIGGGISHTVSGSLTLTNSTVSGNTAVIGGGIFNSGTTMILNSTLAANTALNGAGIRNFNSVYLANSLLANSTGGDNCLTGNRIIDLGFNLADDTTCNLAPGALLTGLDLTLADNGGPTQTHALLPGSPAIDAAGECGLETDQRRLARSDISCDSGSFEFGAEPPLELSIAGICPGEIALTVSTPDPEQDLALYAGTGEGASVVLFGPCAGTELNLESGRQWRRLATDEGGEVSLTVTVSSAWCGRYLQAIERSCSVSNVVQSP